MEEGSDVSCEGPEGDKGEETGVEWVEVCIRDGDVRLNVIVGDLEQGAEYR